MCFYLVTAVRDVPTLLTVDLLVVDLEKIGAPTMVGLVELLSVRFVLIFLF